jgi:hypothetical protein
MGLASTTGPMPPPSSSTGSDTRAGEGILGSGAVRVATIDNYQGEEADVVIVSLVRSNSRGRIGFLREPERINVLLSRARHGCILIGNADTLRNASDVAGRKHWGIVLDLLQQRKGIHPGLPAVCQQHGRRIEPMLSSPEAFRQLCPDGGCREPCGAVLPCGHTCRLRCHSYDREHEQLLCREQVYWTCDKGHLSLRACSRPEAVCSTCIHIRELREEEKKKLMWLVRH